jgi:hypothetical protein
MKNYMLHCLALILFIATSLNAAATCTPAGSSPIEGGFFPPDSTQPCAIRNQSFYMVIQIKNFGQVATGVRVISTRVDTFYNLPEGLSWSMTVPSANPANTLLTDEIGCVEISGTATSNPGIFVTDLFVTVVVNIQGNQQTFSGKASQLIPVMNTQFGTSYDLSYRVFVVDNQSQCPNVSGIAEIKNISDFSVYPNPFTNQTAISFHSDQKAQYLVRLLDLTGKVLYDEHIQALPGINRFEINNLHLGNGFYLISLSNNVTSITRSVLIE